MADEFDMKRRRPETMISERAIKQLRRIAQWQGVTQCQFLEDLLENTERAIVFAGTVDEVRRYYSESPPVAPRDARYGIAKDGRDGS